MSKILLVQILLVVLIVIVANAFFGRVFVAGFFFGVSIGLGMAASLTQRVERAESSNKRNDF